MGKIVVIGSINMDYTAMVNKLPVGGQTLLAHEFKMSGGGKGANQAMAAAIFSDRVKMIGMVGDDIAGHALVEKMQAKGVDVSCVGFCDVPTGTGLINVDHNGRNTIVVYPGANQALTPEIIESYRAEIEEADLIMMQLEIPLETVKKAAEIAYNAKVKILLNPAPAQQLDDELLSRVTYLTPNETELMKLASSLETHKGAAILREKGVKNVIVTLGDKGCYVRTDTMDQRVSSYHVDAIDTTAAGDSFSGALAVNIAKGHSLMSAIKIANATGALTTTKVGAQEALPTMQEVSILIAQK